MPSPVAKVFVVGCQRSGTTMLLDILARSPQVRAFGEGTNEAVVDHRLREQAIIERLVAERRKPCYAFKPLCDAHYTDEILRRYEGSRAVWIYRDYADVAHSIVAKWPGHMLEVARRFRDRDLGWLGWRAERLQPEVLEEVVAHAERTSSELEFACVFWHLRNRFLFDWRFDHPDYVHVARYEDMVRDPDAEFGRLFVFFGLEPDPALWSGVAADRVGRRSRPVLDPSVAGLCDDLLARLDASAAARRSSR